MELANQIENPVIRIVSKLADKEQLEVYIIGGYVRDLLLNRPSKDMDFVVVGDGVAFARIVAAAMGEGVEVKIFKNFGTAMIRYQSWELEFVGARKESYKHESRKPRVKKGSLQDDLNRRDFTINALAIDLHPRRFGKLIDPFGGIMDLNNGLLRTPLDADLTYSDDPLRMMRAIRFASQLSFEIEEKSLEAIKRNRNRLRILSGERITSELNKIILSPKPSKGFDLLLKTGLLDVFFPQMKDLQGAEYIKGKGHKDNFYHTLQVLDNVALESDNLWLRWAAILHDIAKPITKKYDPKAGWTFHSHEFVGAKMVPSIFKQLFLPMNEKMRYVQKLVLLHLRPIVLAQEDVTDSAVRRLLFEAGDDIDDLMMLCEADITSKNEAKVRKYLKNFQLVRKKLKEIEEKDRIRNWQPPVNGQVIMHTFGLQPSRIVGILKTCIREAILDGDIQNNYSEAYAFLLEKGKEMGLKLQQIVHEGEISTTDEG